MFVAEEVSLHLRYPVACARLLDVVSGSWLTEASGEAFDEGQAGTARVGPFGAVWGVSKLVQVRFLPQPPGDQLMCLPMRWEATGPAGGLFPVLDADIVLFPAGERTRLVVSGSYRPPLDELGAAVDKAVLHRVATATIAALVREIASQLDPAGRPAAKPHRSLPPGNGDHRRKGRSD